MDNGYGITATGYNRRQYTDLVDLFETKLKSDDLFGADIDFSDQDPLKHFSVPMLELVSELWEAVEETFYSASPKYAEGVSLWGTGKYIGISPKQPSKATGIVTFTGISGTTIASNTLVSTETGVQFATTADVIIPSSGNITVAVQALEAGSSGNVAAGTITQIVTPLIGLSSVTNATGTAGGQDLETDVSFRTRYSESTTIGSGSTTDAIRASILKVDGVTDASVTENDTLETVDNIPAKSIFALVKGGIDSNVAKAIFDKKPAGIATYGDVSVNVVDSQSFTQTIKFSRPTSVNVWIKADITTGSNFPTDGTDQIKTAIQNYINNISLGEDVTIYKIVTTIANLGLADLTDLAVTLSTDGATYADTNISIANNQVAVTDSTKIEVI